MVGIASFGGYIPRLRLSRKAIVDETSARTAAAEVTAD